MDPEASATDSDPIDPGTLRSARRARLAWRRLGLRVASLTPADAGRLLLVVAALLAIGWLASAAWRALLPFAIGAVVAYLLLPLVDALNRAMPRPLAALIATVGFFAATVAAIALVAPALITQLVRLVLALPDLGDLGASAAAIGAYTEALPGPARGLIEEVTLRAAAGARQRFDAYLDQLIDAGIAGTLGLLNTIGFLLGFLAVPFWLLSVLNERRGGAVLARALPAAARPDFLAVARIVDRAFRAFVSGQVVLGLAAGGFTYVGLLLLNHLGWLRVEYPAPAAVYVGLLQLVPALGPIIGAVSLAAFGFVASPRAGIVLLFFYLAVQALVGRLVEPLVQRRLRPLSPTLLVLFVVALSEFGPLWVLLSAPLVATTTDLFRYVYGRLDAPPRPAGLLPGERPPRAVTVGRAMPLVYRRVQAARRTGRRSVTHGR
jgi:predicted PurR-regulated permease PerM